MGLDASFLVKVFSGKLHIFQKSIPRFAALLKLNETVQSSFVVRDSGKVLRMDFVLKTGYAYPYANITDQDISSNYVNLSALEAIAFSARGTPGTVEVNVITELSENSGQDWDRFRCMVTVSENWRNFVVPVDSLRVTLLERSWQEASHRASAVQFVINAPADSSLPRSCYLELDDVRLIGLTIDQIMTE